MAAIFSQAPIAPGSKPKTHVRRRTKLRRGGWLFAVVTLLVAIGAINGQNNLLFIVLGLLVGCVLASGVVGGGGMVGVRVRRSVRGTPRVGTPARVAYEVTNGNRVLPACALRLDERWDGSPASATPAFVEVVRAKDTKRVGSEVRFHARGRHTSGGVRIRSRFPLGITDKSLEFDAPASWVVRPARVTLAPLLRKGLTDGALGSAFRKTRAGSDGDFLALREYVPGDPARLIAWRPSARLGTPVVRLKAQGHATRAWVVLEPAESTDPRAAERAASVAAEVARAMLGSGRPVGLLAAGLRVPIGSGRLQIDRIDSALAAWVPEQIGGATIVAGRTEVVRVGPGAIDPDDPATFAAPGQLPPELSFGTPV